MMLNLSALALGTICGGAGDAACPALDHLCENDECVPAVGSLGVEAGVSPVALFVERLLECISHLVSFQKERRSEAA